MVTNMPRKSCLKLASLAAGVLWAATIVAGENADSYLAELLEREAQLIEQTVQTRTAPDAFGSDPFSVISVPQTNQTLVLLRNSSEVLLLDSALAEASRKATPHSPTGWTLVDGRFLFITGELSNRIALYKVGAEELVHESDFLLKGSSDGVRDITYVPSLESLFLIDSPGRKLIQITLSPDWRQGDTTFHTKEFPIGAGALQLRFAHGFLFLNMLLEHRIDIVPMTPNGPDFTKQRRIVHNGPIWNFDTTRREETLLIAAVGVEDRPLDRTQGEFGYVDSYLFLYGIPLASSGRFDPMSPERPRLFTAWNLSRQNIVTPKSVRFQKGRQECSYGCSLSDPIKVQSSPSIDLISR